MKISRKAVTFIINSEVISPEYYMRHFQYPYWPRGDSGVSGAIGYDFGYHTRKEIIEDWRGRVKEDDLQILLACSGVKGEDAKKLAANPVVRKISIPYTEAYNVFARKSLPKYAKNALEAYKGLDSLFPDAIGAIVSLVYNRGAGMGEKGQPSWDRRKEMRELKHLIPEKDYEGIATAIENMKRLWEGDGMDGLLKRRDNEAALVRNSNRDYKGDELLEI